MGSSHSSLEQGTASIIPPDSRGRGSAASSAHDGKSSGGVQLSATTNSDRGHSLRSSSHSQQLSYTPPTSPIKPMAHYIFLVHGWLGNDLEMAYLSKAFSRLISPNGQQGIDGSVESSGRPNAKRVRRSSSYQSQLMRNQHYVNSASEEECDLDTEIVVHSVKCNVGKTSDGIRNGGKRLANEIVDFIRSDVQTRLADSDCCGENNEDDAHVTYSLVGNSLGGLYARYAVSLLPYQLHLQQQQGSTEKKMINLHPNIFCTTATPHLGVSRHTYLPIPRIAETIIGTGMGTTGRDLFRLNSEKDFASAAAGGIMDAAAGGVRRLTALGRGDINGDSENNGDGANTEILRDDDDDELECIIHNMCVQDKYLTPLRHFRQRIAYANAYGTDFQVPTLTAAFLNEKSGVGHFVVASRQAQDGALERSTDGKAIGNEEAGEDQDGLPPFIVAIVRTEKQSQPQSPTKSNSRGVTPSNELLRMSQSLDALGWTKVFIDVRDKIPVPGLAKPAWLRTPCGSLDDLIRERGELGFTSLHTDTSAKSATADDANVSKSPPPVETSECILTSQELAQSTQTGDSIHFPLGHTVMVANSKSERYSQLNSQGRPVMDRLAEDLVRLAEDFE